MAEPTLSTQEFRLNPQAVKFARRAQSLQSEETYVIILTKRRDGQWEWSIQSSARLEKTK